MLIFRQRVIPSLLLGMACIHPLIARSHPGHEHPPAPRDLIPVLAPVLEKHGAPAIAAAATLDGQIVALGTVGVRDLDSRQPVTLADRSMIGSCGKSITRLLVARLVDKKLLRWDSTLGELLSDVPMRDDYRSVTIGDIIGHRGGLQPYTEIGPKRTPVLFDQQDGSARDRRAAFIAHLLQEPPSAPPKTQFIYSNAGYGLLGHIAERLADKSYEKLIRDEVFTPLQMKSALVGMPRGNPSIPGWAGHLHSPQGFKPVLQERPPLPAIAPAGLMSCSIEDFAKLGAELVRIESGKPTDFLSPDTARKLPELRPGGDGEGEIFYGGDGTFTAAFALWPSSGLSIVVQSNAGDSDEICAAAIQAVRAAVTSDDGSAPPQKPVLGLRIEAGDDGKWTIAGVEPGLLAAAAGLAQGDRITAINGKLLKDIAEGDRTPMMRQFPVKLTVDRAGKTLEFTLTAP